MTLIEIKGQRHHCGWLKVQLHLRMTLKFISLASRNHVLVATHVHICLWSE